VIITSTPGKELQNIQEFYRFHTLQQLREPDELPVGVVALPLLEEQRVRPVQHHRVRVPVDQDHLRTVFKWQGAFFKVEENIFVFQNAVGYP
jgi:hypothetical protein